MGLILLQDFGEWAHWLLFGIIIDIIIKDILDRFSIFWAADV